ncbi:U-box domain-containing protein 19 [Phtheirospermum japonicum]|uniref:RING-type E3 ubiquitin transferase n=1 Tax=Phtheirospermum japonicum TaxID=374723 RepID=A0A830BDD6_9LAMI|nr:U-box domain-containing protein 19 [Phtheirospermum japonicum]
MKSKKVSSHFRELIRAVTVALDVLPLSGLEISDDVHEFVEFVRKKALKSNFDVERDDKRAMERAIRIIGQFESGIAPESSDLKSFLEYLGIKSWNECDNEVRFLESEATEEKDVRFLSSLIALLIYCRCAVFENIDSARNYIVLQPHDSGSIRFLKSDDLRCPISLEIMTDPVTIPTGHTYDRKSIAKWFKSGNHTCPKTGQRLISVDLVPNLALKRLIKLYCQENGIIQFPESGGHFHQLTESPAAEQAMAILANFLVRQIVAGKTDEQKKASYEIRLLTKTSIFNRSRFVEADAIPPLLNLLRSENWETQENSMAALLNLSKYAESKEIIVKNRGLNVIVDVLNGVGVKLETRQHAAGALFYLASVEAYRKAIGGTPGAIAGLMDLVRAGSGRGLKNGLAAILGLLMYPENHWRFLSAGLVLLLVNVLTTSEREEIITGALAVLVTLAEKFDGAMAIVSAGALPVIIKILGSYSIRGAKEYCVSLLLALCLNDGADVVPVLVKDTSVMANLYSVLADGSSRSSKNASSLIGILLAFDEITGSGFRQEHFIHVW